LLYLDERTVWEGMGFASDRRIFDLPFEQVEAATLAGDLLWVLADGQLARVDLISGALQTLAEIEVSDWGSHLLAPRGRSGVFYAAGVEDSSTLLGHATCVGYYDVQAKQARLLTKLPGGVILLGSATDEDILYAVRMGGDGGISTILAINLEDGTTSTEAEPQRVGIEAAVSPDGRWLAIIDAEWDPQAWRGYVTLYNLARPDTSPAVVELPQQPSHASASIWTPDSQYLYFVLYPGSWTPETRSRSYGLWRLDVSDSDSAEQVVPSLQPYHAPIAIAPDGRAVLVSDASSFTLLDVQTGAEGALNLPPGARFLAWRVPE
jgi:hypothetical protein